MSESNIHEIEKAEFTMNESTQENLTLAEIRRTMLQLARHQIDEQGARRAINGLRKIMRASAGSGALAANHRSNP